MAEKVKEKKKHKGLKVLGVIILIIALIVGIGFGVIYYLTKPVDDTSDKAIYVGGMRSSQSIDYKSDSAKGLENDIIVKIMQVSWKFCDKSDKKRMARMLNILMTATRTINLMYFIPKAQFPKRACLLSLTFTAADGCTHQRTSTNTTVWSLQTRDIVYSA